MTIKELSQLYYLNREIEMLEEKLEKLEARTTGASVNMSGLPPTGNASDRVGDGYVMIADLKSKIQSRKAAAQNEVNKLYRYIDTIQDSYIRQIIELRFVSCLSWLQVALCIGGNNTADSVRMAVNRFLQNN